MQLIYLQFLRGLGEVSPMSFDLCTFQFLNGFLRQFLTIVMLRSLTFEFNNFISLQHTNPDSIVSFSCQWF